MSLGMPNTYIPRLRRAPPRPYKAYEMRTQYIQFDAAALKALEVPLGTDLEFRGAILGQPIRVTVSTTARSVNPGLQQPGYWQDDLLANLDHAAKAMTQLQLEVYDGSWEFHGPESVVQNVRMERGKRSRRSTTRRKLRTGCGDERGNHLRAVGAVPSKSASRR